MRSRRILFFCLVITLIASPLWAHDMWIEPSTFRPQVGSVAGVRLRVGDHPAEAQPVHRDPTRIVRFAVVDADGEEPILGLAGTDPAGYIRPQKEEIQVLGYHSAPSFIELEAEKFESYLADKGLEKISALRAQHSQTQKTGREHYSRCLKSLLAVGREILAGSDRILGFPLELIAADNPYQHKAGDSLSIQLLFDGNPLADALVKATPLQKAGATLTARTDTTGRVSFRFPSPGAWLLTVVHMVAAPEGSEADWESFWASLTFALPSEKPRGGSVSDGTDQ